MLTHVDDDHIYGAVPLLGDQALDPKLVGDVWFNGWLHLNGQAEPPADALGPQKGEFFAALLQDRKFPWNEAFGRGPIVVPAAGPLPSHTLPGGLKLTVLSPTPERMEAMRKKWEDTLQPPGKPPVMDPGDHLAALAALAGEAGMQPEDALGSDWLAAWDPDDVPAHARAPFEEDSAEANGSTIALLAEYDGRAVLLGGDAYPSVLLASLARLVRERGIALPLPLTAFKIPHHGSENNLNADLVAAVACSRWLVSTNGTRHHHPNPAAVARILRGAPGAELLFNHRSPETEVWDSDTLRLTHDYTTTWGTKGRLKVTL